MQFWRLRFNRHKPNEETFFATLEEAMAFVLDMQRCGTEIKDIELTKCYTTSWKVEHILNAKD